MGSELTLQPGHRLRSLPGPAPSHSGDCRRPSTARPMAPIARSRTAAATSWKPSGAPWVATTRTTPTASAYPVHAGRMPCAHDRDTEPDSSEQHDRAMESHQRAEIVGQSVVVGSPVDQRVDDREGEEDEGVCVRPGADRPEAPHPAPLHQPEADHDRWYRRLGNQGQQTAGRPRTRPAAPRSGRRSSRAARKSPRASEQGQSSGGRTHGRSPYSARIQGRAR